MKAEWRLLGLLAASAAALVWVVPFAWMAVAALRPGAAGRDRDHGGLRYALPDGSKIVELVHPMLNPNVGLSPSPARDDTP
jgi:hypothetical protein